MASDLISTAEAAERRGVVPQTIARWVSQGKLVPAHKLAGRTGAMLFRPEDVDSVEVAS